MWKNLVASLLFLSYLQAETIEEAFERGHNLFLDRKYEEAIEPLEQACKEKHNKACIDLGTVYSAIKPNYKKAFDAFKIACDNKNDDACGAMAEFYVLGKGIDKDIEKGLEILNKNVEKENSTATFIMATLYARGGEVNKDYFKALNLGLKSCEKGEAIACRLIAEIYQNGLGVSANKEKAFEFFKKSCVGNNASLDAAGCVNAGAMLEMGSGTNKNVNEALKMYNTACSLGENLGCSNYGLLLYKLQKYQESLSFNSKACDHRKVAKSCYISAIQYATSQGVSQNEQYTIKYLKLACEYGENDACSFLKKLR